MDRFRDRVFAYLDATNSRWATLNACHAVDVALDISGQDDPFEGADINHLISVVNEWFCEQGRG
jgi:hypothetical protein